MKLGKALATGVAEEKPLVRAADEPAADEPAAVAHAARPAESAEPAAAAAAGTTAR